MASYLIQEFKGIDQSVSQNVLSASFSPDARNMETENGDLAVAKGYVKHLTTPIPGTGRIWRLYLWHKGAEDLFLVASGNTLYRYHAGAWQTIYTYTETITSPTWDFQETRIGTTDYLIIANGQAQLVKWDGGATAEAFGSGSWVYEGTVASVAYNIPKATNVTQATADNVLTWTLTMPTGWAYAENAEIAFTVPSTISAAITTAKITIGDNTYTLNYVPGWNSGYIGVAKLTSATEAVVSLTEYGIKTVVLATAIDEDWKQRALDIGVRLNEVTRQVEAISDDRLTLTLREPVFDALAPGDAAQVRGGISDIHVNYVETHFSRLFSAGDAEHPSRLYWSQPPGDTRTIEDWSMDDDASTAGGGHVEVGNTSEDGIVGLCSLSNQLLIFKESSIYRLLGTTPDDFRVVQVNLKTERMHNTGLVKYGDTPFWLTRSGMYYHDGSQGRLAGSARRIRYILQNADLTTCKAIENRDRLYFTCKRGAGDYDDSIVVYNMVEQTYMLRDGFHVIDICSYNGTMYLINENRYVYRFGEGDSYDGARIDAYWTTPKTDMGAKGVDKHLRKLLLRGEGDTIIIDYQVGIFTDSKRYMIPRTEDEICEISLQNRGRTVQFKIRNEAGSYFRLTGGVEIEYDGGRT